MRPKPYVNSDPNNTVSAMVLLIMAPSNRVIKILFPAKFINFFCKRKAHVLGVRTDFSRSVKFPHL